jgi:hypothetical protein
VNRLVAGFVSEVHSSPSVAAVLLCGAGPRWCPLAPGGVPGRLFMVAAMLLCDEIVNVADLLKASAEVTQSGVSKPSWPKPLSKAKLNSSAYPPPRLASVRPQGTTGIKGTHTPGTPCLRILGEFGHVCVLPTPAAKCWNQACMPIFTERRVTGVIARTAPKLPRSGLNWPIFAYF